MQGPVGEGGRVQGSGFRERGQNAEVGGQGEPNSRLERAESRGQRSGGTGQPEQPFNARGARDAKGTGILLFYLKPATWNLQPKRTATRTDTDGGRFQVKG